MARAMWNRWRGSKSFIRMNDPDKWNGAGSHPAFITETSPWLRVQ